MKISKRQKLYQREISKNHRRALEKLTKHNGLEVSHLIAGAICFSEHSHDRYVPFRYANGVIRDVFSLLTTGTGAQVNEATLDLVLTAARRYNDSVAPEFKGHQTLLTGGDRAGAA
tara:strand:- start:7624 stop:7971 length:348 start_codon:yes stop_codon:yes gene_type:complete